MIHYQTIQIKFTDNLTLWDAGGGAAKMTWWHGLAIN